jgi:molybdopterin molybdotransferase
MIPFDEALAAILDVAVPGGVERVGLGDSLNRILAEDVVSDSDVPPFDKAAMDGYACRRADLARELTVVDTIVAGRMPTVTRLGPAQCARIMTGGVVPAGADCVVMQEDIEETGAGRVRCLSGRTAGNICLAGEDVRAGDTVLERGRRLRSQHVATLAMAGCAGPLVYVRPTVGIIATGSELVAPHERIAGARIRDCNSAQLVLQVLATGAQPHPYGIVSDEPGRLDTAIRTALKSHHVVVITGGVSVGEFDLVPGILARWGCRLVIQNIAIKPGRPTLFGVTQDGTYCFGLPGNPLSAFVVFELLVKPFIYRLMGHAFEPPTVAARLGATYSRKKTARMSVVPVAFSEPGTVVPVECHGAAHVSALCNADALLCVAVGAATLEKGTPVNVRPLWT